MVKILIGRLIKKHGMKNLILLVGDYAVKATKSKEDDKIWAKVKKLVKSL